MFVNSRFRDVFRAAGAQRLKRLGEALFLVMATSGLAMHADAATVTVSGAAESSITAAISSACNGRTTGTVTFPNGTYGPITSAISVPSYCTLQAQNKGQATINATNNDYALFIGGNGVTVNGLVFSGAGIITIQSSQSTPQSNVTITNNTFKNIFSGKSGIASNGVWYNAKISYNTFSYITNLPWSQVNNAVFTEGGYNYYGSGIVNMSGMDQSKIEHNEFDHILNDCMHLVFNYASSQAAGTYTSANNNSISYNTFHDFHRMSLELQGQTGGCFGGCSYFPNVHNMKIAGNYAYAQYAPYYDAMVYSLVVDHSLNSQIINNTGIMGVGAYQACGGAEGMENSGDNTILQGNVLSATISCAANSGWPAYSVTGGVGTGVTHTHQNELFCGASPIGYFAYEAGNSSSNPVNVVRYNYTAASCPNPGSPETSTLSAGWTSAANQSFPNGGNGSWNLAVTNELSIAYVQFYLDGASTPVATQELQDLNTNFAADRKWLYHAAINTSNLKNGTHSLSAVATDVSGATRTITQTFQVGNSSPGIPAGTLAPGGLQFGAEQLNSASAAQIVTLSNTGTATLNVTDVQITGSNSSDFSSSTTCGLTLAVAASCKIEVVFTPTAAGTRSATLSVTDNATIPTLTVALSGSGTSPAPPSQPSQPSSGTLPTNLPTGMLVWLANDAGVVTSGSSVSAWEDQSGNGNGALQSNPGNQPTVVAGDNGEKALHFNGTSSFLSFASLPINGSTGISVFIVSASANDPSAGYGFNALLMWPETESWGETFFGSYQTTAHFRFGTTQAGNESSYTMPFTRTNSFGLSEWMHAGTTDCMWFNGQSVATIAGKEQQMNGIGNSALLGKGGNNTFYSGDVSEVIVYARSLSASERQTIEQYLMAKYHL